MSKEQLWTDAKIKDLSVPFLKDNESARFMATLLVEDMRNDYERALAFRNEDIGRLRNDMQTMQARIAELEAEMKRLNGAQWQPILDTATNNGEDYEIIDPYADDDRRVYVADDGSTLTFSIEGGALEGAFMLPDGYAICRKVQPAEAQP